MTAWSPIKRQVAIAGRVVDGQTEEPMGAVKVSVAGGKAVHSDTVTRPDGLFFFLDLPDGEYRVSAVNPQAGQRYGEVEVSTKVLREAGRISINLLTLALPPTAIRGRVTSSSRPNGVTMAEVRLRGSGERTFSNAQGEYQLIGIEPSKQQRTVLVSARGYKSLAEPVTIEKAGITKELNFTLDSEGGNAGTSGAVAMTRGTPSRLHERT